MPSVSTLLSRAIVSVCLIFVVNMLAGQSGNYSNHSIFFEIAGAAPNYSLNYAKYAWGGNRGAGFFRVGLGIWDNRISVPIGFSIINGGRDNFLELSFMITPFSEGYRFWKRNQSDIKMDLMTGIGYKYQPRTENYFFNLGIFPYVRLDPTPNNISSENVIFRFRPGIGAGFSL